MSKASQRRRSSAQNAPQSKLNPQELFKPIRNERDAAAHGKTFGEMLARFTELEWDRYRKSQGDAFDEEAHEELEKDMLNLVMPLLESIQSSILDSVSTGDDEAYDPTTLPCVSGTAVFIPIGFDVRWIVEPMPFAAIQHYGQREGKSTTACDYLKMQCDRKREEGCDLALAFWFESGKAAWAPLQVAVVHGDGAAATYALNGDTWAKGPPSALPSLVSEVLPMDLVTKLAGENPYYKAFQAQVEERLAKFLPADKAVEATRALVEPCLEWNAAENSGTFASQIQLAEDSVYTWGALDRYETELKRLRKDHEDNERKLRKSAAHVTDLKNELERTRAIMKKMAASNQASVPVPAPVVQPTCEPLRSTPMAERMSLFFG
jgi:hypothetical protein